VGARVRVWARVRGRARVRARARVRVRVSVLDRVGATARKRGKLEQEECVAILGPSVRQIFPP